MAFGVIQFPGSNCDHDCYHVAKEVLKQETYFIWHADSQLPEIFNQQPEHHVIMIPGGFSYGDYLRCGAIAHLAPVMEAVKKFAAQGGRVIGICNGFQILTESGLLPGALLRNKNLKFICQDIHLKVVNTNTPFTTKLNDSTSQPLNQVLKVPIAHGEGNYFCDTKTLENLKKNKQIIFQYSSPQGDTRDECNPNGSIENIAGVCNETFNVLGMMPHPERCAEELLGNQDGLKIFESLLKNIAVPA